jgi:succinylglutamate desuccinylase
MIATVQPNGSAMSDLERYLTSKLNSQFGLRYQQLLDELQAAQKEREVPPVCADLVGDCHP